MKPVLHKLSTSSTRFSNLLPYSSPQEHDKLDEELIEYQLLDDSEIPESVWKSATIQENESVTYYRMDVIWHYLANLKAVDGSYRFGHISKVAKTCSHHTSFQCRRGENFFYGSEKQNVIPTKP